MATKLFYIAPLVDQRDSQWYSPGRLKKVSQVTQLLQEIGLRVTLVNTAPYSFGSSAFPVITLSDSLVPFARYIQIALGSFRLLTKLKKTKNGSIFWIYNTRFPELLSFLLPFFFSFKSELVLQIEDIPGARLTRWSVPSMLDNISTKIMLCLRPKYIFAVDQVVAASFAQLYKIPHDSIFVLPPLLSTSFCEIISSRPHPFLKDEIHILYSGGYEKEKGVDLLADAVVSCIRDSIPVKLSLVGAPPPTLIAKYANYSQNIIFKGPLTEAQLIQSITCADIMVNPHAPILNSSYIFPFKNIEILSSGCLPLFTRLPGTAQFSLPEDCLFNNEDELKEKLRRSRSIWRDNKSYLLELARAIRHEYSTEKYYTIISSLLRSG